MSEQKDGGPAFGSKHYSGMSLRDWLAGMALNGQLSNYQGISLMCKEHAKDAYKYADAMLEERDK